MFILNISIEDLMQIIVQHETREASNKREKKHKSRYDSRYFQLVKVLADPTFCLHLNLILLIPSSQQG